MGLLGRACDYLNSFRNDPGRVINISSLNVLMEKLHQQHNVIVETFI